MVAYCYPKSKLPYFWRILDWKAVLPRLAVVSHFSYHLPRNLSPGFRAPMHFELEIKNCSRTCAATSRAINPGEVYFSVLEAAANEFLRHDYCVEAWAGPPEECVGWWRSRVPTKEDNQPRLAPTDVMLNLFEALAERPAETEFRYLLGLLLLRRRVLRRDDSSRDDQLREVLQLHCQSRNKDYDLIVAEPVAERAVQLQQQMINLLYGDGGSITSALPQSSEPQTSEVSDHAA
jgi:hypothetical protein